VFDACSTKGVSVGSPSENLMTHGSPAIATRPFGRAPEPPQVFAVIVMSNHVHLVVRRRDPCARRDASLVVRDRVRTCA
jgi:hypothetical protein